MHVSLVHCSNSSSALTRIIETLQACINRKMESVRSVADTMEAMFLETIERGDGALRDFDHQFVRNISKYVS